MQTTQPWLLQPQPHQTMIACWNIWHATTIQVCFPHSWDVTFNACSHGLACMALFKMEEEKKRGKNNLPVLHCIFFWKVTIKLLCNVLWICEVYQHVYLFLTHIQLSLVGCLPKLSYFLFSLFAWIHLFARLSLPIYFNLSPSPCMYPFSIFISLLSFSHVSFFLSIFLYIYLSI